MKKLLYIIIILFECTIVNAYAVDYYVSKSGSDQTNCITAPGPNSNACKTIMYIVINTELKGGDNVYLQAGTYEENISITSADSGSNGSYVTFKTYQNDDVTIISNNANYPFQIYDSNAWTEYIKLDGSGTDHGHHLRITTTASERCLMIRYARNIWVTNVEIENATTKDCIKLTSKNQEYTSDDDTGSKNCIIEYSKIHDCGDYGIKLTGYGTNDNTIRYNNIYSNGGRGRDNYGMNLSGSGYLPNIPQGNKIYENNFYNNYKSGLQLTVTVNNKIYNNRFYNNGTGESGRGMSFGTDANNNESYGNEIFGNSYYGIEVYSGDSNKIYQNVIYDNTSAGIRIQNTSKNNEVYNNSIYDAGVGIYLSSDTSGTIIKNNNVYVSGSDPALHNGGGGTGTLDHNNWYREGNKIPIYWNNGWKNIEQFYQETGHGQNSISAFPEFADLANKNFSLKSISPCIDKGTDIQLPFKGKAPDMGALEFNDNNGVPNPPENLRVVSSSL